MNASYVGQKYTVRDAATAHITTNTALTVVS
ncbi:uncharacterized protein METZ01_LOCUS504155 [marine metagenome]|uniref:Uncharacterized protein n=1 Tax=marine metagenome TaxID=408172 RepID=A0A383E3L0_9ZZZZ